MSVGRPCVHPVSCQRDEGDATSRRHRHRHLQSCHVTDIGRLDDCSLRKLVEWYTSMLRGTNKVCQEPTASSPAAFSPGPTHPTAIFSSLPFGDARRGFHWSRRSQL